jgi:calcineurin-like phosphoesterase family protein
MSIVRYISDLHLNHNNMALRRGFVNFEEHDQYIIKNWNNVVNKRDVVYILGDVTFEKSTPYILLEQLNGIKKVILGNHDKPQHVPELLKYVNNVASMKYLKDKRFGNIIFTHAPIHPCELEYRYNINIHGHVHENTLEDKRYINVSAEVIDFKPKTLEELLNG